MKQLLAIAVIALFPLALNAQTQHFKFTNDGAFAAISADSDPLSNFRLQVSRSSFNRETTANIIFFAFTFAADFSSATLVQIGGQIPNSAFTGDNTQTLVLDLDPSTLDPTNSFSQSCTLDFSAVDPVFTCGAAPAGCIPSGSGRPGTTRHSSTAAPYAVPFSRVDRRLKHHRQSVTGG